MNAKQLSLLIALVTLTSCATATWRGNAVRDRLTETPGLGTHEVSIDEREKGLIALRGTVSSEQDRYAIEQVARNTSGVKEVQNNLVVAPSSVVVQEGYNPTLSSSLSQEQRIVSDVMAKIAASPEVQNYKLNVAVDQGIVTLRGAVGTARERDIAQQLALTTPGVARVTNEITLMNQGRQRSDAQITLDVREVLSRSKNVDLSLVAITTRDGVVTFRGVQNSRREADQILSLASSVRGVRDVRNELVIRE